MKFLKILIYLLVMSLIPLFAYVLTLMGPARPVESSSMMLKEDTYAKVDAKTILKEAQDLEKEFDKLSVTDELSDEILSKLEKAIKLQEAYIAKRETTSYEPTRHLMAMQVKLDDAKARPFVRIVEDLQHRAQKAEEEKKLTAARDFYSEAYDMQSKINVTYPHSKYKSIRQQVLFASKVEMIDALPLHEKSLKYEKLAKEALENKDLVKAKENLDLTIKAINELNSKFPTSVFADYARLLKLKSQLASLNSGGLFGELNKLLASAKKSQESKDFNATAIAYEKAADLQSKINKEFPDSAYASDSKFREFQTKKIEALSNDFLSEIQPLSDDLTKALHTSDSANAAILSSNLLAKTEQFKKDYPQSTIIDEEMILKFRYINFISKDLSKIKSLVLDNLNNAPIEDGWKMLKTEVSQELYSLIMQENPSRFKQNIKAPVDSTNLEDVMRFCNRLAWALARKVDIPTQANITKAIGSLKYVDVNDIAWDNLNSGSVTHSVGSKRANDNGYFDLLGNVAEFIYPEDKRGVYALSIKSIGGDVTTSSDQLLDIPLSTVDVKQRSRMIGFRIVVGN